MRSIGMLAMVAGTVTLASACGDNGGGATSPENEAPMADFEVSECVAGVPCDFVSTSTDDVGVTAWIWDFDGDDDADANTESAVFTYGTAGEYSASLTVRDGEGLSDTKTGTVTVSGGTGLPTPGLIYRRAPATRGRGWERLTSRLAVAELSGR